MHRRRTTCADLFLVRQGGGADAVRRCPVSRGGAAMSVYAAAAADVGKKLKRQATPTKARSAAAALRWNLWLMERVGVPLP